MTVTGPIPTWLRALKADELRRIQSTEVINEESPSEHEVGELVHLDSKLDGEIPATTEEIQQQPAEEPRETEDEK